jgi:hypothetical protein
MWHKRRERIQTAHVQSEQRALNVLDSNSLRANLRLEKDQTLQDTWSKKKQRKTLPLFLGVHAVSAVALTLDGVFLLSVFQGEWPRPIGQCLLRWYRGQKKEASAKKLLVCNM